jgi:NitT/TauT family transport system permease protein
MSTSRLRWFARSVLPPVLVLLVVIGGIELIVAREWVSERLLPRPSSIFRVFFPHHDDPLRLADQIELRNTLLWATWGTAKGALLGFALSVVVGTVAAVLLASSTWIRRAFYPYAVFFQTVPIIAIAPLLVIWFDFGIKVVIAASFIASIFPVIANTLTGLLSTEPALREMFKLYGAGPITTVWKLRLPFALPSMFTGYRIAGGLAVIGAIVGEFVSSGGLSSLGAVIDTARTQLRTDVVFAAVLLASLLGLGLFIAISTLSSLLLRRWHASEQ